MSNLNIQSNELVFSLDFVSMTGIGGPTSTYTIRALLSTPFFDLNGGLVNASISLPGTIKLRGLTEKLISLGETEESVNKYNKEVLENCFNPNSKHYCFQAGDLENFLSVASPIAFKHKNGSIYRQETTEFEPEIKELFLGETKKLKEGLTTGRLPEVKPLLNKLNGMAYSERG